MRELVENSDREWLGRWVRRRGLMQKLVQVLVQGWVGAEPIRNLLQMWVQRWVRAES